LAVLRWINRHQPLLTLHGHIHESPDVTGRHAARLGRTVCHQPGQRGERQGLLVYSMVTIEEARHVRIERRMERVG
jgi:Icc-related predicted phosphoesterase